ncbi:MAG: uroporphyrinogen-III synthase [Flavipsychrobacter sp.]
MANKVNILCTVPIPQPLIDMVADKGIDMDIVSLISIQRTGSKELQNEIEKLSGEGLNVIFTSANAVEIVKGYMLHDGSKWNVYCIGNATKKAIENNIGVNNVAGIANNASELADVIINDKVKDVVFFCGDIRRDELPTKLKKANVTLRELVVYKTIQNEERISKVYDGILFFSPSAVGSFFSRNDIPPGTTLFAIGETTAEAIKTYTSNELVVGKQQSKEAMIDVMIDHFKK